MRWATYGAGLGVILMCGAFDLFRSENSDVKAGNDAVESKRWDDAISSYRRAQRTLPDERGIDLDLGVALGKKGDHKRAIEQLERAAESNDPGLRAQALYDLGNEHFRVGDELKDPKTPEDEKKRFEALGDAASAFKRSLTMQVQDPIRTRVGTLQQDTRWNLELTLREMKKDEKKRQEEQQKNGQNGQNGQQQQNGQGGQNGQQQGGQNGQNPQNGQGGQNGQQQGGQNGQQPGQGGQGGQQQNGQNGQNGQQNQQNGQGGQQSPNGQNGQNGQQPGQNGGGQNPQQNGQPGQGGQNPQPGGQNGQNGQQPGGQNGQGNQTPGGSGGGGGNCDPSKEICGQSQGDNILDTLERSEHNLQLERARQHAGRRRPVKDW